MTDSAPTSGEGAVMVAERPSRLRRRITTSVALVMLVTLVVAGFGMVSAEKRSLTRNMERSARTFVRLLAFPLVAPGTEDEAAVELLSLKVASYLELNEAVRTLRVVDVNGGVRMTADRVSVATYPPSRRPRLSDPELMEAVRSSELTATRLPRQDGSGHYRVVAPLSASGEKHLYSLVAEFDYADVNREILRTLLMTGALLLVGLVVVYQVSASLARRVSWGIDKLHEGVLSISRGRFDQPVEVATGDEIEDLAEAFNSMSRELSSTIEELRQAYGELLSLDQAKEDLLANVSHELKTPLTALRGYLELLAEGRHGELDEQARSAVTICRRNLDRLTTRIDEMMQVAEAQRGVMELTMKRVRLTDLLHGVVESLLPRFQRKGVYVSLNLAHDLPSVRGSVEHLERIFFNLLENALKFTPEGGTVRVSAHRDVRGGAVGALVGIADSGPGIPPDRLTRVFDRFYQVDPSARKKYGGMGLGLALVRTYVEAHDGAVWAESEPGAGATFFVWLPRGYQSDSGDHPRYGGGTLDTLNEDGKEPEGGTDSGG